MKPGWTDSVFAGFFIVLMSCISLLMLCGVLLAVVGTVRAILG